MQMGQGQLHNYTSVEEHAIELLGGKSSFLYYFMICLFVFTLMASACFSFAALKGLEPTPAHTLDKRYFHRASKI